MGFLFFVFILISLVFPISILRPSFMDFAEGHLFYLAFVQTYVIVNIYHQRNQGLIMSVLVSM
jgi:hypothetical protein